MFNHLSDRELLELSVATQLEALHQLKTLELKIMSLITDVQTMQADWNNFKTVVLPQIIANALAQANVDDATADQIVNQVNSDIQAQAPSPPPVQAPPTQAPGA